MKRSAVTLDHVADWHTLATAFQRAAQGNPGGAWAKARRPVPSP